MIETNSKRNLYIKVALSSISIVIIGLLLWKFDFEILFFIQKYLRNDILDVIVPFYTSLGEDGIIWITVGVILLIPKKTRKCGIMVLCALLVMLVVNNIVLKNLIARSRPCWTYPEMVDLVEIPKSYSFPSGHTVSAFAVSLVILSQHKKLGIVTVIMAALMAFTRLYVFVHFPTDIFGGMLVGASIACFVCFTEKKLTPIIMSKLLKKAE